MVFHVEVLFDTMTVRISAPKHLILALLCQGKRQMWYNSTLASRRKRLTAHFEDLEQCYFSSKMSHLTGNYEEEPREVFSAAVVSVSPVWTKTGSGSESATGSGNGTHSGTGTLYSVWVRDWVCF